MLTLSVAVLLLLLLAGSVWATNRWRWSLITSKRVLVHVGNTTLSGIVFSRRGPLLCLVDAEVYEGPHPQKIDGQLVIERSKIDWLQVVS